MSKIIRQPDPVASCILGRVPFGHAQQEQGVFVARVVSCILGSRGYWFEPEAGEQWISSTRKKGFTSLSLGTWQSVFLILFLQTFPSSRVSWPMSDKVAWPVAITWLRYPALSAECPEARLGLSLVPGWDIPPGSQPCHVGSHASEASTALWRLVTSDKSLRAVPRRLTGLQSAAGLTWETLKPPPFLFREKKAGGKIKGDFCCLHSTSMLAQGWKILYFHSERSAYKESDIIRVCG